MKDFWTAFKCLRKSGTFLESQNSLDSVNFFGTGCKISRLSGELPDSLEDSWREWKVSRQYGRFQTGLKISGNLERLPDSLGCMFLQQINHESNANQTAFTGEMLIDRNGPVFSRANHILSASFDCWFGTRGWCHFHSIHSPLLRRGLYKALSHGFSACSGVLKITFYCV